MSQARKMKRRDVCSSKKTHDAWQRGVKAGARAAAKMQRTDIQAETLGNTLLTMLVFLRIKRGFGYKRLKDFMADFDEFIEDCERECLTHQKAHEVLMECGFDVVKEFEELEIRARGKSA